jgi:uncharacterized protein
MPIDSRRRRHFHCFIHLKPLIPAYMGSYTQTYVERDVRRMADLSGFAQFVRFLRLCGALSGREIMQYQLGREPGINPKTSRVNI